jgi:hypothetical protein
MSSLERDLHILFNGLCWVIIGLVCFILACGGGN